HLTEMPDPEPLVRTLYRVRHDLVMIGRAAAKPLPRPEAATLLPRLIALRDAAAGLLTGLADALGSGKPAPSGDELDGALKAFTAEMDHLKESPPRDGMERIFTLRFSFEQ